MSTPTWDAARAATHAAGLDAKLPPARMKLADADATTLAEPLTALGPLPAFPTSSVDGYAVSGPGPWRLSGQVVAGQTAPAIETGQAIEIATGAMVPPGTEFIIRTENSTLDDDGRVTGTPRPNPEWREIGEETAAGEELLPAGSPVTPVLLGLAAATGHDVIDVRPKPRAAVLVFGDELATTGAPGPGHVRDALGPMLPTMLRRFGAGIVPGFSPRGPIEDTLDSHVAVIRAALDDADIVCTTGGTMRGPRDHLHAALDALDAKYVVDSVAVRPGFPMLIAALPGGRFVAGLPGNPQSAVVALVSLVLPLIDGMSGRDLAPLREVTLGEDLPGRGNDTHLALVHIDDDGLARPTGHAGSAMLRGLAAAHGFAVIEPGTSGTAGDRVRFLPVPGAIG